jgi:hypothetical protein
MHDYDYNPPRQEPEKAAANIQTQEASFPWGMFFVAALFDLVGLIPLLNILTEILASGIIWFWQKTYAPKEDPLLSLITTKIIDFCSLGIFPSNIGMVVIAYMKKKTSAKLPSASKVSAEPTAA